MAGVVAVAGSATAVAFGLARMEMAIPFAVTAAILAGVAVLRGSLGGRDVARAMPLAALAFVLVAAVLSGPVSLLARDLPRPAEGPEGLFLALVVGGALSITVNNLPAAAAGGVWLAHAHPSVVVAFLVGTNIAAVATPHGSAATMLARAVGTRRGVVLTWMTYVRGAWRYAVAGSLAAFVAILLMLRLEG